MRAVNYKKNSNVNNGLYIFKCKGYFCVLQQAHLSSNILNAFSSFVKFPKFCYAELGEVECQNTDVTEDLPPKEIDKSSIDNNDNYVGRPSTKIFLLKEDKDNDTERTTGPTPRDSAGDFESTTFPPGINLLLTPQIKHDEIYKTRTESPLDNNKTTKKRMGKLILFVERRRDEISRKYDISDKRFLRRRGQIWRIKGDDGSQIETSSALTPTGAVTREGNRAPQHQRPFPGGSAGYLNKVRTTKTHKEIEGRYRQQESRNKHLQHQEPQKSKNKLKNSQPPPENNVRNLVHPTTPVDQLQVIRMMAERMKNKHEYKQYSMRSQTFSAKQQRNSKNRFITRKTESNVFKEKVQVQETEIGAKNSDKEKIQNEADREKVAKRNSILERNKIEVTNDNANDRQNNDEERSLKHSGNKDEKSEFRTLDPSEDELNENRSSIDIDSGITDAVTPPTLFNKVESDFNSVQRERNDKVHRSIENILSRMEATTGSSPILHRLETSTEVPSNPTNTEETRISSMYPSTLLTIPPTTAKTMKTKKSTISTSATTSSTTRKLAGLSQTTLLNSGESDSSKKQSRDTYNKDSKLQTVGNSEFHFRKDWDNIHNTDQTSDTSRKWNDNSRGILGQNIRRHLPESIRDLYHDDGANNNQQELGSQPLSTIFSTRMTRIKPAVKWDGRRSTISKWLKTLKPTGPQIPTKISRSHETSTIHDYGSWKNYDFTPRIYQPNRDELILHTRVNDIRATTETTSKLEVVTNNLVTSDLPYDILMEEEKIATQFTDISISLGMTWILLQT